MTPRFTISTSGNRRSNTSTNVSSVSHPVPEGGGIAEEHHTRLPRSFDLLGVDRQTSVCVELPRYFEYGSGKTWTVHPAKLPAQRIPFRILDADVGWVRHSPHCLDGQDDHKGHEQTGGNGRDLKAALTARGRLAVRQETRSGLEHRVDGAEREVESSHTVAHFPELRTPIARRHPRRQLLEPVEHDRDPGLLLVSLSFAKPTQKATMNTPV